VYSEENYIKVMEYSRITISNNKLKTELFILDSGYLGQMPYPFCGFQYITSKKNVSSINVTHYEILMINNFEHDGTNSLYPIQNCRFILTIAFLTVNGYLLLYSTITSLAQ